jgi:hypothetical protein
MLVMLIGPQAIFMGLYAPVQENLKKSSGAREACRAAHRRALVWLAQASAGTPYRMACSTGPLPTLMLSFLIRIAASLRNLCDILT